MIDVSDIERLRELFVTKDGCRENYCAMEKKIDGLQQQTTELITKMSTVVWLLRAIAVAAIGIAADLILR